MPSGMDCAHSCHPCGHHDSEDEEYSDTGEIEDATPVPVVCLEEDRHHHHTGARLEDDEPSFLL